MTRRAGAAGRGYGSFVGWAAIGAGACLALLTPLTIGPLALVAVVVAACVLARRGIDAAVAGLLSGAGLLLLYIAFLNRSGPGGVCESSPVRTHCTSAWSPWPWLVVGVALVAAGVLLYRRFGRGGTRPVNASPVPR